MANAACVRMRAVSCMCTPVLGPPVSAASKCDSPARLARTRAMLYVSPTFVSNATASCYRLPAPTHSPAHTHVVEILPHVEPRPGGGSLGLLAHALRHAARCSILACCATLGELATTCTALLRAHVAPWTISASAREFADEFAGEERAAMSSAQMSRLAALALGQLSRAGLMQASQAGRSVPSRFGGVGPLRFMSGPAAAGAAAAAPKAPPPPPPPPPGKPMVRSHQDPSSPAAEHERLPCRCGSALVTRW
jgi:hypothetical protein